VDLFILLTSTGIHNPDMGFDYESRKFILLASAPLLILGITEIVFGVEVFQFASNAHFGAWWAGVGATVTFLSGWLTTGIGGKSVFALIIFICAVICFTGTLVDGISYAVAGKIKICGNDKLEAWGDSSLYDNLIETCNLPNGNFDCYCMTGANSLCLHFQSGQGFDEGDCEPLTDDYGRLLKTSYSLCLAMFFYCGPLFVFALTMCCRREKSGQTLLGDSGQQQSQTPIAYYDPYGAPPPQQQHPCNGVVSYAQPVAVPPQYAPPPPTAPSAPPIMVVATVVSSPPPTTSPLPSAPGYFVPTEESVKYE
jgi:hypothetical protein